MLPAAATEAAFEKQIAPYGLFTAVANNGLAEGLELRPVRPPARLWRPAV